MEERFNKLYVLNVGNQITKMDLEILFVVKEFLLKVIILTTRDGERIGYALCFRLF